MIAKSSGLRSLCYQHSRYAHKDTLAVGTFEGEERRKRVAKKDGTVRWKTAAAVHITETRVELRDAIMYVDSIVYVLSYSR